MDEKDASVEGGAGVAEYHAHESIRPSVIPAGTAGTAGCPEQNAPEQGSGTAGA
jgi:hypothetical protein